MSLIDVVLFVFHPSLELLVPVLVDKERVPIKISLPSCFDAVVGRGRLDSSLWSDRFIQVEVRACLIVANVVGTCLSSIN